MGNPELQIGQNIRLTRPNGVSDKWHARVSQIQGDNLFVMVVRPNCGRRQKWSLWNTIRLLRSGYYEFGRWGD